MKQLSTEQRIQVVSALVEGNSIRSIVRMTGIHKTTILKLIADLGTVCQKYHDEHVRDLKTERVQCDEIWAFCYCKQANVPKDKRGLFGFGDVWTWTAIDADSKLMINWHVGLRDAYAANQFMRDLDSRLANRVQMTTDGWLASRPVR